MAKTQEELNELKEEIKTISEQMSELTQEELEQVAGGFKVLVNDESSAFVKFVNWLNKIVSW